MRLRSVLLAGSVLPFALSAPALAAPANSGAMILAQAETQAEICAADDAACIAAQQDAQEAEQLRAREQRRIERERRRQEQAQEAQQPAAEAPAETAAPDTAPEAAPAAEAAPADTAPVETAPADAAQSEPAPADAAPTAEQRRLERERRRQQQAQEAQQPAAEPPAETAAPEVVPESAPAITVAPEAAPAETAPAATTREQRRLERERRRQQQAQEAQQPAAETPPATTEAPATQAPAAAAAPAEAAPTIAEPGAATEQTREERRKARAERRRLREQQAQQPAAAAPASEESTVEQQLGSQGNEAQAQRIRELRRKLRAERQENQAGQPAQAAGEPRRREGQRVERRGDRDIIRFGSQIIIRPSVNTESERLLYGARDVRVTTLPNGFTETVVFRENGSEVVTVRNEYGEIITRVRRSPNGREVVLIDNRYPAGPPPIVVFEQELPPLVVDIPREQYIVETRRADEALIAQAFEAPPVEEVERAYTLEEIRGSERLRDKVRRVDLDTITFDTGSAVVKFDQLDALDQVGTAIEEVLAENPEEVFLIEGHTDAVGSDEANLILSDRRAEAVAVALSQDFAIPPENLVTQGYGEQFLKVPTEAAERENRRVTMRNISPLLTAENQ